MDEIFNRFIYLFNWRDKSYLKDFVQKLQPAEKEELKTILQNMEKVL